MSYPNRSPQQGEVWLADLNPPVGHEQAGPPRPVIIVSGPAMNEAPYGLSLVVPVTSRLKNLPGHIFLPARDSGLRHDSEIMCEHVRSISHHRFRSKTAIARLRAAELKSVITQIGQLMES